MRWAIEVCNDFETNELLMDPEGPPIEISWAIEPEKPSFIDGLMGKEAEEITFEMVAPNTAFDEDLRCGFLGKLAREYRGGGVSARYERIVIGKDPEVPIRADFQKQFDKKYN